MTDKLQSEKAVEAPAQNATPRQHAAGSWIGMAAFFLVLALIVSFFFFFFLGISPHRPGGRSHWEHGTRHWRGGMLWWSAEPIPTRCKWATSSATGWDGYTVIHRIVERQDAADGQAQAFITQGEQQQRPGF